MLKENTQNSVNEVKDYNEMVHNNMYMFDIDDTIISIITHKTKANKNIERKNKTSLVNTIYNKSDLILTRIL